MSKLESPRRRRWSEGGHLRAIVVARHIAFALLAAGSVNAVAVLVWRVDAHPASHAVAWAGVAGIPLYLFSQYRQQTVRRAERRWDDEPDGAFR